MDTILHFITLAFIPLLALLVFSGIQEIYQGLKEHFKFDGFKVSEVAFNQSEIDLPQNFGFNRINTSFCKN